MPRPKALSRFPGLSNDHMQPSVPKDNIIVSKNDGTNIHCYAIRCKYFDMFFNMFVLLTGSTLHIQYWILGLKPSASAFRHRSKYG